MYKMYIEGAYAGFFSGGRRVLGSLRLDFCLTQSNVAKPKPPHVLSPNPVRMESNAKKLLTYGKKIYKAALFFLSNPF